MADTVPIFKNGKLFCPEIYTFPNFLLNVSTLEMEEGRMTEGGEAVEGDKEKNLHTDAHKSSHFRTNLMYFAKR